MEHTAFASTVSQDREYPSLTVPSGQAQPLSDSADIASRCMSDGERALRIGMHDSMSKHYTAEWEGAGNFADLGRATWHQMRRDELMEGRAA